MIGVKKTEGEVVVMVLPVDWVGRHIVQRIVHPPHVPFKAKPKSADIDWARHHRPGGRLLRYRSRAASFRKDQLVKPPQKRDRIEVLAPSEGIRDPFAFATAVIEIQH